MRSWFHSLFSSSSLQKHLFIKEKKAVAIISDKLFTYNFPHEQIFRPANYFYPRKYSDAVYNTNCLCLHTWLWWLCGNCRFHRRPYLPHTQPKKLHQCHRDDGLFNSLFSHVHVAFVSLIIWTECIVSVCCVVFILVWTLSVRILQTVFFIVFHFHICGIKMCLTFTWHTFHCHHGHHHHHHYCHYHR